MPASLWAALAGWPSSWMVPAKRSCARVTTQCVSGSHRKHISHTDQSGLWTEQHQFPTKQAALFSPDLQRRCRASPSSSSSTTPWCQVWFGLWCSPTPGTRPLKPWAPPTSRCPAKPPISTWWPGPFPSSSLWPFWLSLRCRHLIIYFHIISQMCLF